MTKITYINLSDLDLPEFEAHSDINQTKLQEITESIKQIGVLEPILVRKHKKRYEIIVGCIRFRASRLAGLKAVPCIIHSINDKAAEVLKIHENIKRISLDHVDQGNTFIMMRENFKMNEDDISKLVGKSISYISNHINLVTQDKELSESVKNGSLSFSQARELLQVPDLETRKRFQTYCQNEGATVRVLKQWIQEYKSTQANNPPPESDTPEQTYQYPSSYDSRKCEACLKPIPTGDIRQLILCSPCHHALKQAISEEKQKEPPEST